MMATPAWTIFVRLSHWLVAACVLLELINDTGSQHRMIGYFCVGVVMLRIIYGIFSKIPSSLFYLPSVKHIKLHVKGALHGMHQHYDGHNPLGQWAVYAMWLLIILLGITGWISRTDTYWGEDWPVDWHLALSNLLIGCVVMHVFAVLLMSRLTRVNLIGQMLTGKSSKRLVSNQLEAKRFDLEN